MDVAVQLANEMIAEIDKELTSGQTSFNEDGGLYARKAALEEFLKEILRRKGQEPAAGGWIEMGTSAFKFGELLVEVDLPDRPSWAPPKADVAVYRALIMDGVGGAAAAAVPARPGGQRAAAELAVVALCMASFMTRTGFSLWAGTVTGLEALLGPGGPSLWVDQAYDALRDASAGSARRLS